MYQDIIKKSLFAGLIMLLLEYFVLLRIYKRKQSLHNTSLFFAFTMMFIAVFIVEYLKKIKKIKVAAISYVFIIVLLMEIPLSLIGYELEPEAAFWERLVVAGSFGTVAYGISKTIL